MSIKVVDVPNNTWQVELTIDGELYQRAVALAHNDRPDLLIGTALELYLKRRDEIIKEMSVDGLSVQAACLLLERAKDLDLHVSGRMPGKVFAKVAMMADPVKYAHLKPWLSEYDPSNRGEHT